MDSSSHEKQLTLPSFGYELLRDTLIPELLGNDTNEISYWAGKRIARKFPLQSNEEIQSFFNDAGWGQLECTVESKDTLTFELTGEIVAHRLEVSFEPSFRLETGFLAEQIQLQKELLTEAVEHIHRKQGKITITVQWDKKDPIK